MHKIKFLLPAIIGTAVYVCLSVCFGPESILVYSRLEKQKYTLQKNVQKIELINENLAMDYLALRVDAEVIAGYAKRLGYIAEGEKLIKMTGIPYTAPLTVEAGTPIVLDSVSYTPEWVCKLCGLAAFAFFSLLFFADTLRQEVKKRRQSGRPRDKAQNLIREQF